MKAEVITAFRDAQDAEKLYRAGEPFEGSPARVNELAVKGFVKPVKAGGGRPSKDELLKELGETKTNPELAEMLGKVPHEPKAPRRAAGAKKEKRED